MKKTPETDGLVYQAALFIREENKNGRSIPAYPTVIWRFLKGCETSAFLPFYKKHPDLYGMRPALRLREVKESLSRLAADGKVSVSRKTARGEIYTANTLSPSAPAAPAAPAKSAAPAKPAAPAPQAILSRLKKGDPFDEYRAKRLVGVSLMAHQKAGAEIAERYDKFAFFYDTGTGKTLMALSILAEKAEKESGRFLIVAPKPLIKNAWLSDARHFPDMRILPLSVNISFEEYKALYREWAEKAGEPLEEDAPFLREKNRLIEKLTGWADHFIINMESIVKKEKAERLLEKIRVNGLVVDESAILKNFDTKSSRRVRVISAKMKYVYLLSGKPAPNSPLEYFSQMKIVDPQTFSMSFDRFRNAFFVTQGFRSAFKNKRAEKEVTEMIGRRSIVVRKDECLDLPEETRQILTVEPEPQTRRFYKRVLANLISEIVDMEGKRGTTAKMNHLARLSKLREIACGFYLDEKGQYHTSAEKLELLLLLLDSIGQEEPVIIWCNFQYEIQLIEQALEKAGKTVVTAYGKTKSVDDSVVRFQSGGAQYLIAHPKTLKYGVTFTNCHYAVYNSLSFSYEDYYQSHDRIFRKGQKNKCFFYHLITKDTIEQYIYENLKNKDLHARVYERLIKESGRFSIPDEQIARAAEVARGRAAAAARH